MATKGASSPGKKSSVTREELLRAGQAKAKARLAQAKAVREETIASGVEVETPIPGGRKVPIVSTRQLGESDDFSYTIQDVDESKTKTIKCLISHDCIVFVDAWSEEKYPMHFPTVGFLQAYRSWLKRSNIDASSEGEALTAVIMFCVLNDAVEKLPSNELRRFIRNIEGGLLSDDETAVLNNAMSEWKDKFYSMVPSQLEAWSLAVFFVTTSQAAVLEKK